MASTIKLPVQIADNLNYLKEKSSQLTALVEKKNATPQAVTSVLENYSSKSSRTSSSEFESETTSESSNESSDSSQIIIIIDDAYDTLSEIKSKSSTNSSSKSQEYNNSESSSENTNYYNNSSNSELDEDNQAGGAYDDKDDSLTKFNNFIKKYKEYWTPEVRNYFDSLINNAFNSGSVADVCNAANVSNKDIFIDSADIYENASLQDFLSNFNEMKLDYIDYCDKLISILENELLETTKEKRTIRYSFRKLSVDELHDLQKKCRRTLLEMYTSNHEYYLKGIGYLKRYFTSTFYKKSQANKK
jgi:hypothetical protein